jgi:hypothetical protein
MKTWVSLSGAAVLGNGDVMYYGRTLMGIPSGSKHVRTIEIRVPALQGTKPNPGDNHPVPVVHATVYTLDGGNEGTIFAVYQIDQNNLGTQSQITVNAVNTATGVPSDLAYYCSVTIIGTPIATKPINAILE